MKAHKTEADKMNEREAINHERRLTSVEINQQHLVETLIDIKNSINQRFDMVNQKFDMVHQSLVSINQRFDRLENIFFESKRETNLRIEKIDARLWSLVFFMFAGFGTILGVMAHGFGWV